jgi:hypothetical protein
MARAALRLLQDALGSERLDFRGHLLGLMAHYDYSFSRFQGSTGGDDMLNQGPSAGSVQNLSEAGL